MGTLSGSTIAFVVHSLDLSDLIDPSCYLEKRNRVFGSRSLNYRLIGLIFINLVLPRWKKLGFCAVSGFLLRRNLYPDFAVASVSQSIFLCLTVDLLFDLALRDSIRCAIPDVVADDGYGQKSACNAVMTRVRRDWSALRQTAIICEYVFTHPLPQTQNRGSVTI